jgi:protease inhibitor Inh
MAIRHVLAIFGLAISLAGCGAIGAIDLFRRPTATAAVQPLPPPVDASQLPPLSDGTQVAALPPYDQPLPQPGATGAAPPPPSGLGRTDLLGGWTITAGGDSCQLFMTLTSWTGGYRATTRGCNSDLLKSVSAWNLSGNQVILAGMSGSPIAHLKSSGLNRFDGTSDSQGAQITFYR